MADMTPTIALKILTDHLHVETIAPEWAQEDIRQALSVLRSAVEERDRLAEEVDVLRERHSDPKQMFGTLQRLRSDYRNLEQERDRLAAQLEEARPLLEAASVAEVTRDVWGEMLIREALAYRARKEAAHEQG